MKPAKGGLVNEFRHARASIRASQAHLSRGLYADDAPRQASGYRWVKPDDDDIFSGVMIFYHYSMNYARASTRASQETCRGRVLIKFYFNLCCAQFSSLGPNPAGRMIFWIYLKNLGKIEHGIDELWFKVAPKEVILTTCLSGSEKTEFETQVDNKLLEGEGRAAQWEKELSNTARAALARMVFIEGARLADNEKVVFLKFLNQIAWRYWNERKQFRSFLKGEVADLRNRLWENRCLFEQFCQQVMADKPASSMISWDRP